MIYLYIFRNSDEEPSTSTSTATRQGLSGTCGRGRRSRGSAAAAAPRSRSPHHQNGGRKRRQTRTPSILNHSGSSPSVHLVPTLSPLAPQHQRISLLFSLTMKYSSSCGQIKHQNLMFVISGFIYVHFQLFIKTNLLKIQICFLLLLFYTVLRIYNI